MVAEPYDLWIDGILDDAYAAGATAPPFKVSTRVCGRRYGGRRCTAPPGHVGWCDDGEESWPPHRNEE